MLSKLNTFDGKVAIEDRNDNGIIHGFDGSVNHEDICIMNTSSDHTVTFDFDEEGKIFVLNEQIGYVEASFKEGLGRGGKASVKRG